MVSSRRAGAQRRPFQVFQNLYHSLAVVHKITLTVGFALLLVSGILAYAAITNVGNLATRLESVHQDASRSLWQAEQISNTIPAAELSLLRAIAADKVHRERYLKEAVEFQREFALGFKRFIKAYALEAQKIQGQKALQAVLRDYPLLKAAADRIVQLLALGKKDQAQELFDTTANPLFAQIQKDTTVFTRLRSEEGDSSTRAAQVALAAIKRDMAIAFVVSLAIAFFAAIFLTRIVLYPLREMVDALREVGKGNLPREIAVQSGDEIGELASSFNQMIASLWHSRSESARDLKERAKTESALRESEERFQLVTRATNDVIWDWDVTTGGLWWNGGIHTVFGYAPDEVGNDLNWWLKGVHPDDAEPVGASVHQFLDSAELVWTGEYRYARADGSFATVIDRGIAVRGEDGKAVRMIGSMLDITEMKRIELDLEHARDAALESVRAKSEFLANMSHEIRTPLNGVIGMTGLLLNTQLTAEQRRYAQAATRSGESLLIIINDILDFSKIEAGKISLETVDFDLSTVLENAASVLAGTAHAKDVELAVSIDGRLPATLHGDPFRLSQVLTNLANNAVKFTPRGEVILSAKPVTETEDSVTIRFEVRDTGIGITPSQQERLFRPFTQADSSTTRKYGGTGLGLVISSQIVKLMGGEIGVESEPGQGSLFWFTVPFRKVANGIPANAPNRAELRGRRVLVVDDNATNRFILREQIRSWQMSIDSAESGPGALELLRAAAGRSQPYDLAILDMQMPEMDGLTLARAIKHDPQISGVVLILLTSIGAARMPGDVETSGISASLSKPTRQSELYDCMVGALSSQTAVSPMTPDAGGSAAAASVLENSRSHIRVLVAEDNLVNQEVARGILEARGYRVDVVANGREAVQAVIANHYAAVLMDCQMPEIDGYEAAAQIRKIEGAPGLIPIIALTAHALPGEREKCLAAGMNDYLGKPVRPDELYQTLERWIVNSSSDDRIDFTVLDNLRKMQRPGAPDLLSKVIDLYLADTPPRLAAVREEATHGHSQDLWRLAHALKGSSASLGARHMVRICTELEALASSEHLEQVQPVLTDLEAEFDSVRVDLETRKSGECAS